MPRLFTMRPLLFTLVVLCLTRIASAQLIDPYETLVNPRAIANFAGDDRETERHTWGVGWPNERDTDYFFVVAKAEGAGIVTHVWLQLQDSDIKQQSFVKIWVDDSLVAFDNIHKFFRKANGLFRPPLDSIQSGGLVCDVQIPYRRNFKITFHSPWEVCCVFWAITWRPVQDSNLVRSFRHDDLVLAEQQRRGEEAYWRSDPWQGEASQSLTKKLVLQPGSTEELVSLDGPGMIQAIEFTPSTLDSARLMDLWLRMYWDHSPEASVQVPFADFFGAAAGVRKVRAFQQRVENGKFTSYFPMPFYRHARITLENRSEQQIELQSNIRYNPEAVDRKKQGYFTTQFVDLDPVFFGKPIIPASWTGRGRFIGMHMMHPGATGPYFLEGDPVIFVDKDPNYTIHYVGSEDYFNGGWFFSDGPMSLPFGGCTNLWTSLYRFHYLDAIDFKKSFRFELDHGDHNFWPGHFRTVGFLYTEWTPYWLAQDTLLRGDTLKISGSGYLASQVITLYLDGTSIVTSAADAAGSFSLEYILGSTIPLGAHRIKINEEERPIPLVVIQKPALRILHDIPQELRWRDSLRIKGYGFREGEKLSIYLGETKAEQLDSVVTGSDGSFVTRIRVPWVDSGRHTLSAKGDRGSIGELPEPLLFTRSINYEIEEMWPPISVEAFARPDYLGYFKGRWSKQQYLLFQPFEAPKSIVVPFNVAYTDTFRVDYYLTYGKRFGRYRVFLDDRLIGDIDCFLERDYNDPIRSELLTGGVHALEQGRHTLTFTCIGKNQGSDEYLLGADNLILTPVSTFESQQPKLDTQTGGKIEQLHYGPITVTPNPVRGPLKLTYSHAQSFNEAIDISLVDVSGKIVMSLFSGLQPLETFSVERDTKHLAAGAYFVLVRSGTHGVIDRVQVQIQ